MSETWNVRVDIFDVTLSYKLADSKASLEVADCNCDIEKTLCRHVEFADARVRAVFHRQQQLDLLGTITHAPRTWCSVVDEDCEPIEQVLDNSHSE